MKQFMQLVLFLGIFFSQLLLAADLDHSIGGPSSTPCLSKGKALSEMNEQALKWRESQTSGYKNRALLVGTVDEVFADQTGHRHFSIKIGPHNDDHIEVIYNEEFGAMPIPQAGDTVNACGDFIVATQSNGGYPPSPDGALIHWVHKSPNPKKHDDGFVILNGQLYGFGGVKQKQSSPW